MNDPNEMPEWKTIRTMSICELFAFLENNEKVDPHLLAIVCSEVLRRQEVKRIEYVNYMNNLVKRGVTED